MGSGAVVPPIFETWKRCPTSGLAMHYVEGKPRWQLYPHKAYKDEVEFGGRVASALGQENDGKLWFREDTIVCRAVKASPGMPFADFINA